MRKKPTITIRRSVSLRTWVASCDGCIQTFTGRTYQEALGRLVLFHDLVDSHTIRVFGHLGMRVIPDREVTDAPTFTPPPPSEN